MTAQQRIAWQASRPARIGIWLCVVAGAGLATAWVTGVASLPLAIAGWLVCVVAGAGYGSAVWRTRTRFRAVVAAERQRIERGRTLYDGRITAMRRRQAASYRSWRQQAAAAERHPAWRLVSLPGGIDRVDVVGGTLAGWSAMVTTMAAPRLAAGGDVTVLDVTEGAVAADLVGFARETGLRPLVWLLPGDLPRLDLGAGLARDELAEVLALAAGAAPGNGARGGSQPGPADLAADRGLLERVLDVVWTDPSIARVTAALRVLGEIGDPQADLRADVLTGAEFGQIGRLFGRAARERVVIERAWSLEARLRGLEGLASEIAVAPPSRLRVASLDRAAGPIGNQVVGTYLTAAITHTLRRASRRGRWEHVLFLLGAERLDDDLVGRLADACETSATGLVLAFRSIPTPVRQRLGRGDAAIAFMRLGNGEEARAASELIGSEHRLVVSQFTDTVGTSVTGTWAGSYTSTVGTSSSVSASRAATRTAGRSRGRGRNRTDNLAFFGGFTGSSSRDASYSVAGSESVSLTEGISGGTSWGRSTSRAVGENAALGRSVQRSRELLVEPHELQCLPQSAVIVSYPGPSGRNVVLADANPGIMSLAGVTPPRGRPGPGRSQA